MLTCLAPQSAGSLEEGDREWGDVGAENVCDEFGKEGPEVNMKQWERKQQELGMLDPGWAPWARKERELARKLAGPAEHKDRK